MACNARRSSSLSPPQTPTVSGAARAQLELQALAPDRTARAQPGGQLPIRQPLPDQAGGSPEVISHKHNPRRATRSDRTSSGTGARSSSSAAWLLAARGRGRPRASSLTRDRRATSRASRRAAAIAATSTQRAGLSGLLGHLLDGSGRDDVARPDADRGESVLAGSLDRSSPGSTRSSRAASATVKNVCRDVLQPGRIHGFPSCSQTGRFHPDFQVDFIRHSAWRAHAAAKLAKSRSPETVARYSPADAEERGGVRDGGLVGGRAGDQQPHG